MFAPRHHSAMAHVGPARAGLGVRTVFNFLGPLTNPAGATRQLVGVADRHYQETIAEALIGLGTERALVVSAEDGVDELALSAPTRVIEVFEGRTAEWFVEPGQFGLAPLSWPKSRAARRPRTPPPTRAVLAGETRPAARHRPAQRRRRDLRRRARRRPRGRGRQGGRRGRLRRGRRRAREADRGNGRRRRLVSPRSVGIIEQLIDGAREGVDARQARTPAGRARGRLSGRGEDRPFQEALVRPGLSVIAEFKRRSPSVGDITPGRRRRRPGRGLRARRRRRRSRC